VAALREPGRHLGHLSEPECLALLATKHLGRIAVTRPGLGPLVVPVGFDLDADGHIVFRSAIGAKVDALMASRVSFQVDDVDSTHGTGWSVLVEGTATVRWADDDDPRPGWAPDDLPFLVRLAPDRVTGRRLQLDLLDTDQRGYR
jgi:hypothetical protein